MFLYARSKRIITHKKCPPTVAKTIGAVQNTRLNRIKKNNISMAFINRRERTNYSKPATYLTEMSNF